MQQQSLQYYLHYTHLISDCDSKTFPLLTSLQSYGPEHTIEKLDCIGHVQKRLGTALRNLKVTHRGCKLDDEKTIGGAGCLMDQLINSFQNYGDVIRQNKGDLQGMVHMFKHYYCTLTHLINTLVTSCARQERDLGVDGRGLRQRESFVTTRSPFPLLSSNFSNQCMFA